MVWAQHVKYFVVGLLLLAAAAYTQTLVPLKTGKKNFLSPPENMKYFTLGYNDLLVSSLWIRLLQDFEFCEGGKFTSEDFVMPDQAQGDSVDRVLKRKIKDSKCNLGWVYLMLNSMTEIQPNFKIAYTTGAVLLSVLVDDREGARRIYEKGLNVYPNDWELNFAAGYHYLWEIQDAAKAAVYFDRAAKLGSPPWVASLAASLYTKAGQATIAKVVLEDALRRSPNSEGAVRIKARLQEVEKILQEKP